MQYPIRPFLTPKCHIFRAPWLIMTSSGLDDWVYWHLPVLSLLIIINYNKWLPKARSIYIHIPFILNSSSFWTELITFELDSLIATLHGPHGEHGLYCCKSLFRAPLPSKNLLLFRAFACAGICLATCCLAMGKRGPHRKHFYNTFSIVACAHLELPRYGSTRHSIMSFWNLD
jgi:hypothetical protein